MKATNVLHYNPLVHIAQLAQSEKRSFLFFLFTDMIAFSALTLLGARKNIRPVKVE